VIWELISSAGYLSIAAVFLHLYWCMEALTVVKWQRRHLESIKEAHELAELLPGVPVLHDLNLNNVELASQLTLDSLKRIPRRLRPFYLRLATAALDQKASR
jgi:hypothetical protein